MQVDLNPTALQFKGLSALDVVNAISAQNLILPTGTSKIGLGAGGTRRAEQLAVIRSKGGVTSYLEVTTAQSAALSDEVTAVNILGRRMVDAVTLVQALGGGWDRSALPDRPECCGRLVSSNSN